jgi:hypothetical protein
MKILHLATDEKFLDHAIPVFEQVFPGNNEAIVFSPTKSLKFVKLIPKHVETKRSGFLKKRPKLSREVYEGYDLVVLHSLDLSICPELQNIPHDTATVWVGWGYDYYTDLLSNIQPLLPSSQALSSSVSVMGLRTVVARSVKALIPSLKGLKGKIRAIERVSIFCPVLPIEYDLVKKSRNWKHFPDFVAWNYGTMEDNLIKGFEGGRVDSDALLIGNSASLTGNHIEALELLHQAGVKGREIVVPLSYGNKQYARKVKELGATYFGDNFEPLTEFMAIEDYVATIKKCGYVIMNHVRQQGVGNIVIMLYLGARVFVREENPVYFFFKDMGVILSSVQELESSPELLQTPLTTKQREINKALVSDYWSRERAYNRTKILVEKALETRRVDKNIDTAEPAQ